MHGMLRSMAGSVVGRSVLPLSDLPLTFPCGPVFLTSLRPTPTPFFLSSLLRSSPTGTWRE